LDKSYRLPTTFKPSEYDVHLTFNARRYSSAQDGVVKIYFKLTEQPKQQKMTLHANNVQVSSATLCRQTSGSCSGQKLDISTDSNKQTVTLSVPQGMDNVLVYSDKTYAVELKFKWHVRTSGGSRYGGAFHVRGKYAVVTQGEQLGMRKIIPCFDEPGFKAIFNLKMTLLETSVRPVSNTNIASKNGNTYTFKPTPPMASYLLAFAVPEGRGSSGTTTNGGGIKSTVYGTSSYYGRRVGNMVVKTVDFFNKFWGVKDPMEKVDYAANYDSFAMENWGMIYGYYSSSEVVVHEVAHHWFGDQVTCAWWDDVWLNEGWTAYATAMALTPLGLGSSDRELRSLSSNAIRRYGNYATPLQSSQFYGSLSDLLSGSEMVYRKGAAVARMIAEMLGGTKKSGPRIAKYLKAFRFQSASSQGLARVLGEGNPDYEQAILDFTTQGGLPAINVRYDSGRREFVVTQSSKLSSKPGQRWTIPVFYSISGRVEQTPAMFPKQKKELRIPLKSGTSARDYTFNPDVRAPISVSGTFSFAADSEEQFNYVSDAEIEAEPEPTSLPDFAKFYRDLAMLPEEE
jgi:aminopeptidase N